MSTPSITRDRIPDFNDAHSWELARRHTRNLGAVSAPLGSYIRILCSPGIETSSGEDLRMLVLKSALRSNTVRTCLTYGAMSLYPGRFTSESDIVQDDLEETLGFAGCASLLGLLYVYRRVSLKLPVDLRERISRISHERAEIGAQLGMRNGQLGVARGILLGGLRFLSLGVVAASDSRAYAGYQEWLAMSNLPFDLAYESTRWGFTHPQVCSLLIQSLGFGAQLATAVAFALTPVEIQQDRDPLAVQIRTASIWIESLSLSGKPPALSSRSGFTPAPEVLQSLLNRVSEVRHSGTAYFWLEKGRARAA